MSSSNQASIPGLSSRGRGDDEGNRRPWYRHAWVWFIISFPATAVIAGFATWYLAWKSDDGLVARDYYKQGLAMNQTLATRETARQLGLVATATLEAEKVMLSLEATRDITPPATLLLNLLNATRAGEDLQIVLRREDGRYVAARADLPTQGQWNLILTDEGQTWQIRGRSVLPASRVVLQP